MSLNPEERKNWNGFLDLLQPPTGYRLVAAVGTTFGLSIDALTAALLAMCNGDGETMTSDPVASLLAITRLRNRVRVLVHPATISGGTAIGSRRIVALLDGVVLEAQPRSGLFHPKVWALRFERIERFPSDHADDIGRLIVGSRNLSSSTSFELGAVFEGKVASDEQAASPFSADVADALHAWMSLASSRAPQRRFPSALVALPRFIRRLELDLPHEASEELRLRWQGEGRRPLSSFLPVRVDRAVVVSPFVRPDFVADIVDRTRELQLVSISESLDALDRATLAKLESRQDTQGAPSLYHVTDHGDPDNGFIDCIHAKLVLTEDARGKEITFVGSANATGPGWGIGGAPNVEAMVEMRPGIGRARFVSGFIRESKTKVHPWVSEYERSSEAAPDASIDAERKMLAALRDVAKLDLALSYDAEQQRLRVERVSTRALAALRTGVSSGLHFDLAPLLLYDRPDVWRRIEELATGDLWFNEVPIHCVTAFVTLRVRCQEPPLEKTRLALARLNVAEADLKRRDDAIRQEIMATANPAAVLNALIRGLGHITTPSKGQEHTAGAGGQEQSIRRLLGETTLERLLQAVAIEPALITEMRLLLGAGGGAPLLELCDRLETAVRQVRSESAV